MIRINAVVQLPPKMGHAIQPKTGFPHRGCRTVTLVLSMALLAGIVISVW
jgi:hypothetical protein